MNGLDSTLKKLERTRLSRRNLFSGAVGAVVGASLFRPKPAFADDNHDHGRTDHLGCALVKPIPGVAPRLNPLASSYTIIR